MSPSFRLIAAAIIAFSASAIATTTTITITITPQCSAPTGVTNSTQSYALNSTKSIPVVHTRRTRTRHTNHPSQVHVSTSTSPLGSPSPTPLDCQYDNCLRQFIRAPEVPAFCLNYTTVVETATTGLPDYVSQCQALPSRISSACSCIVEPTGGTTPTITVIPISGTSTSTSTRSSILTLPTEPQDCHEDNCLRQFDQSTAVTAFCATYTLSVDLATVNFPDYVSMCGPYPASVSSACSCIATVETSSNAGVVTSSIISVPGSAITASTTGTGTAIQTGVTVSPSTSVSICSPLVVFQTITTTMTFATTTLTAADGVMTIQTSESNSSTMGLATASEADPTHSLRRGHWRGHLQ